MKSHTTTNPVNLEERQGSEEADQLITQIRDAGAAPGYDGTGSCYIEFGGDEVARVDVDFYSTPGKPSGVFVAPSEETAAEKADFATSRRTRWFG
jgi:sulfide:quinone oxidoreductase